MNKAVKLCIVLFWLLCVAWLIRFEAFPSWFSNSLSGYENLISEDLLISDRWMKLSFKGKPVGYLHHSVERNRNNPVKNYTLSNNMRVKLETGKKSKPRTLTLKSTIHLDISRKLQEFEMRISEQQAGKFIHLEGQRSVDDKYKGKLQLGSNTRRFEINIPDDSVFFMPFAEQMIAKLNPGDEVSVQIYEPLTWEKRNIILTGLRREKIQHNGKSVSAKVVKTEYRGFAILSWINEQNVLLRQTSSFGLTAEACSAAEAAESLEKGKGLRIDKHLPSQLIKSGLMDFL